MFGVGCAGVLSARRASAGPDKNVSSQDASLKLRQGQCCGLARLLGSTWVKHIIIMHRLETVCIQNCKSEALIFASQPKRSII